VEEEEEVFYPEEEEEKDLPIKGGESRSARHIGQVSEHFFN
jgi:hypothetical protein